MTQSRTKYTPPHPSLYGNRHFRVLSAGIDTAKHNCRWSTTVFWNLWHLYTNRVLLYTILYKDSNGLWLTAIKFSRILSRNVTPNSILCRFALGPDDNRTLCRTLSGHLLRCESWYCAIVAASIAGRSYSVEIRLRRRRLLIADGTQKTANAARICEMNKYSLDTKVLTIGMRWCGLSWTGVGWRSGVNTLQPPILRCKYPINIHTHANFIWSDATSSVHSRTHNIPVHLFTQHSTAAKHVVHVCRSLLMCRMV